VNRTRTPLFSFMLFGLLLSSLLTGCGGGASTNSGGGGGGTPQVIPTLTAIAPSSTVVGASAITLALYGSNFENGATVQWNGTTLSSSWVSATNMTATIPASDIVSVGSATVTVTNPSPGGGTSAAQTFTISAAPAATTWVRNVSGVTTGTNATPLPAQNIVWDAAHGKLYYAIASAAATSPNTIAVIDPIAGAVTTNVAAGNNPDLLSISSDSSYLWVGLDGDHAVQRFLLPGLTKDISFQLPESSLGSPQQPVSLQAAPVSPHTVALIAGDWGIEPDGNGVYVYDDSTPRPAYVPGSTNPAQSTEWIQWGANDSTIYGSHFSFNVGGVGTLNVTSSGVTLASYNGEQEGEMGMGFTQYDNVNGLLYSYSSAFNPVNGSQVGWFNTAPAPFDTAFGPQTCTADSSLGRYYCVEAGNYPVVYELWVFDLNSYAPLDLVYFGASAGSQISPITGYPHHLVRWGNAGLALTTETYGGFGNGGFFLIDGAAVNPKAAADVSSGATTWSYSWISSLVPQQAPAGSGDVTVTINGRNFTPDSTACWICGYPNSEFLPTSYVSSQQLNVTIPASLLASPEVVPISVFDSGSNLYSTDSLTFTVTSASASGSTTQVNAINVAGFAMAWDPNSALLYVGTTDFDSAYPNSIVAISGESGSIVKAQTVGTDPWAVSVSANGQYLYVGYYSATTMTQLPLPGLASPVTWALTNPGSSDVYYAGDLKAAPVSPHATAVVLFDWNLYTYDTGGLVIYDDSVERPDFLGGWGSGLSGPESYETLAWGASDKILTAAGAGGPIFGLQVSPSGVVFDAQGSDNSFNACGGEIHSDFGTGLIYSDCGNVADPTTLATVGTYNASGLVAPDSSLDRVFILGQTAAQANTNNFTIKSFDEKAYTPVSSITLANLLGTPLQFVRWGTSGLAVLTLAVPEAGVPGMLYLIQDATFVSSAPEAAFQPSNTHELVQQRWKRISKADIAKMVQARRGAELP